MTGTQELPDCCSLREGPGKLLGISGAREDAAALPKWLGHAPPSASLGGFQAPRTWCLKGTGKPGSRREQQLSIQLLRAWIQDRAS